MIEADIALGVLASASTVYGFVLAYYIFARTLHFMERDRYENGARNANKKDWAFRNWTHVSDEEFDRLVEHAIHRSNLLIFRRAQKLDFLLLGANCAFAVSAVGDLWFLANQLLPAETTLAVQIGAGFVMLLAGVVLATSYIGVNHVSYVVGEIRKEEKWLASCESWYKSITARPQTASTAEDTPR